MTPLTWLFCPANRPDRYAKALAASDAVIIDLEDAIDPADRAAARDLFRDAAQGLDPERTVVRINPPGTADYQADLELLEGSAFTTVMLPKVASAKDIDALSPHRVIALCETVAGILAAEEIAAAAGCIAMTWGAQDLAVELKAASTRSDDGTFLPFASHARSKVRFAAAAAAIPAIETVWVDIADHDGLAHETRRAANEGFSGKLVIHPAHDEVVRDAFRPSEEQLAWADGVLAASQGDGAAAVGGHMIDRPIIELARTLVARAAH